MLSIRTAEFALSPQLRERARRVALSIGERLLEEMERPDALDANAERYPNRSLNGSSGFALAFLALAGATGDARFEAAMHAQLRRAALAGDRPELGLFDGMSGLRGVAELATAIEPRYRRLIDQCDAAIDAGIRARRPGIPARYGEYDVFFGWSGMRLARCVAGPRPADALADLLAWVVEAESNWCAPNPFHPGEPPENALGMAHGIAGVLATIALTFEEIDDRMREASATAAWALANGGLVRDGMPAFPRQTQRPDRDPYRAVWCSGAAGIGIALLAVGQCIGDADLASFAAGVLAQVCARPFDAWLMMEDGLCHGSAGNALIFMTAARRTGDERFARIGERLVERAIDAIDTRGGRTLTKGFDGVVYDAIGHLNGVAGIATALLTLAGDFDSSWLRLHGM